MNYAVYNIALDIHKTGSQVALSMIRGENKRKIVISLMENGRPYKITEGCTAYFAAKMPKGGFIHDTCLIDLKNNQIICYVTSDTLTDYGEVKCQIELTGIDGGLLFSPTFSLIVADRLYNNEPVYESSEEFKSLAKFLAEMQQKFTSPPYAIICEDSGENITLDDSADAIFKGFKIYGKSTQNGTPTPEAPVDIVSVGDDGIPINIYGKNLVKLENGGYVATSGVPGDLSSYQRTTKFHIPKGQKIVWSDSNGTTATDILQWKENGEYIGSYSFKNGGFDAISSETYWIAINYYLGNRTKLEWCQVEIGNVATPYEDMVVSQNIGLENVLRAIPVTDSSLATYTDSNGQMWCADEIDLEKGVYVQNIYEKVFTGDEIFTKSTMVSGNYYSHTDTIPALNKGTLTLTGALCSHLSEKVADRLWDTVGDGFNISSSGSSIRLRFEDISSIEGLKNKLKEWYTNGNPLVIVCKRATPIETPLSPEIISQYKELHTNLPNTTILNDENAFMEIEYIAEPKSYIKKNSGSIAKVSTVTLAASKWVGSKSPYSQVVNISGIPADYTGTVRLTPEQAEAFRGKDVAFMVGNKNGIITVYCIGQKLANDYTVEIKFEKEEHI